MIETGASWSPIHLIKMKLKLLIVTGLLLVFHCTYSQKFNKNIDKDSLLQVILKSLPEENREYVKTTYDEGNEETKEFLLFMLSMPRSSKKELIENYEQRFVEIERLKKEYSILVPDSMIVSIEFNPSERIMNSPESIDLKIYRKHSKSNSVIAQEWNLSKDSKQLSDLLKIVGWNQNTLTNIKALLDAANCISIENEKNTSIGFARSGMGKYYYVVFDKALSPKEKEEFNDGCTYQFYRDNIVLEYGGGAVGPQCFPDR
jgi:hypothetical protein